MPEIAEIKPCPFCGGRAELLKAWHGRDELFHVVCSKCMSSSPYVVLELSALDYWNKRVLEA